MPIYRLPVVTSSLPLQKFDSSSSSSNQDGRRHHQHPQQHHVEQHPSHTKHHMQQQQQHQHQHQQHQHLDPNENIIKRSNSIPIQTTTVNHSTSSPERVSIIPSDESIVEREIRLQLEREAEIALLHGGDMRSGRSARRQADAPNHSQGDYVPVVESTHSPEMHREPRGTPRGTPMETPRGISRGSAGVDMDDGGRKAIINQYSKVGESLIVRELMEQKRREEELRHHWRNTGMLKSDDTYDGRGGSSSSSEDDYRSRPGSGESHALQAIPTSNIRAIIRVQPLEDPDDDPKRMFITPRLETVIEREIRVQRQREGSLRRARGYPLQSREDRLKQVEVVHPPPSAFHKPGHPGDQRGPLPPGVERRSVDGDASDEQSVQRFATNRLKQEMLRERQRELDLRRQGKIYTISEERVGLEREEYPSSNQPLHVEDSMNSGGYVSRGESEVNLREAESFRQLQPNDFYGDNDQTVDEFVVVENQRTGGGLPSWRTSSELRIEEEVKEARRREKELREQRRLANETLTNQTEQLQLHERQHQRNNVTSQQHNRNFYRRT